MFDLLSSFPSSLSPPLTPHVVKVLIQLSFPPSDIHSGSSTKVRRAHWTVVILRVGIARLDNRCSIGLLLETHFFN